MGLKTSVTEWGGGVMMKHQIIYEQKPTRVFFAAEEKYTGFSLKERSRFGEWSFVVQCSDAV